VEDSSSVENLKYMEIEGFVEGYAEPMRVMQNAA
jgi:hypothetical protein